MADGLLGSRGLERGVVPRHGLGERCVKLVVAGEQAA
jgi:hypothetical protein